MKRAAMLLSAAALLFGTGCSGSKSAAEPSSANTQSITIALADAIPAGTTVQAAATATLAGGGTQPVTSGFRSDNPAVVSVTDSGAVTGVASGHANVVVVFAGIQGTRAVRVVPNYQGNWSGSWTITSCQHTGVFQDADGCGLLPLNTPLPLAVALTQTGDSVTGRVFFGSTTSDPATATIGADNTLSLAAHIAGDATIDATLVFSGVAAGQLSAAIQQKWTLAGSPGEMNLVGATTPPLTRAGLPLHTLGGHAATGIAERIRALVARTADGGRGELEGKR